MQPLRPVTKLSSKITGLFFYSAVISSRASNFIFIFLLLPFAFSFALALPLSLLGFTIATHVPTSEQILPDHTVFVITL